MHQTSSSIIPLLIMNCRACGKNNECSVAFGVIVCDSCRSFFRTAQMDGTSPTCDADSCRQRSSADCRPCRLLGCLQSGMSLGRPSCPATLHSSATAIVGQGARFVVTLSVVWGFISIAVRRRDGRRIPIAVRRTAGAFEGSFIPVNFDPLRIEVLSGVNRMTHIQNSPLFVSVRPPPLSPTPSSMWIFRQIHFYHIHPPAALSDHTAPTPTEPLQQYSSLINRNEAATTANVSRSKQRQPKQQNQRQCQTSRSSEIEEWMSLFRCQFIPYRDPRPFAHEIRRQLIAYFLQSGATAAYEVLLTMITNPDPRQLNDDDAIFIMHQLTDLVDVSSPVITALVHRVMEFSLSTHNIALATASLSHSPIHPIRSP